jgi:hypothetical protein
LGRGRGRGKKMWGGFLTRARVAAPPRRTFVPVRCGAGGGCSNLTPDSACPDCVVVPCASGRPAGRPQELTGWSLETGELAVCVAQVGGGRWGTAGCECIVVAQLRLCRPLAGWLAGRLWLVRSGPAVEGLRPPALSRPGVGNGPCCVRCCLATTVVEAWRFASRRPTLWLPAAGGGRPGHAVAASHGGFPVRVLRLP